jgi:putative transcription factor
MCGSDTSSSTKVKIEGAVLKVCDSCKDLGNEVKTSSNKKKRKKKKSSSRKRGSGKVLVPDYGEKLKSAREDEQRSIKEVADELNEKESLIKKIEKQDLKPDKSLAGKLSDRFDITLYTNSEVSNHGSATENSSSKKATLEDVADIS